MSERNSSSEIRDKIRNFWKPKGRIHKGNQARIKTGLVRIGRSPDSISFFLYDVAQQRDHLRLLKELGIE